MVDAVAEDVVDFDGMRGGAVDQRHRARIAALELFRKGLLQQRRRRDHQARVERRMPIDQRAPRVVRDFRWDRLRTPAHRPIRPTFDDMHDRANVPFGNTGGANDAVDRWVVLGLCVRFGGGAGISEPAGAHRRAVAAGGNVDITARTVAPAFGEALGQQVIVENRAGAGGPSAARRWRNRAPDGYTLLLGSSGTVTAGPAVWKNLAYDPLKDFVAVGPIQSVPIVLTAAPKTPRRLPMRSSSRLRKSEAGQVSIASAGNGSSNHLAIELLMRQAKLKLLHVPYKGSGPAITDLLGSQVDSMMDQLTASIGHIKDGRIQRARHLVERSARRCCPNVPTLDELGVKGYEAATWTGIFAPAGTPPAGDREARRPRSQRRWPMPGVRERYSAMGVEIMDMGQAEFAAYVRADYEKWQQVARDGQHQRGIKRRAVTAGYNWVQTRERSAR